MVSDLRLAFSWTLFNSFLNGNWWHYVVQPIRSKIQGPSTLISYLIHGPEVDSNQLSSVFDSECFCKVFGTGSVQNIAEIDDRLLTFFRSCSCMFRGYFLCKNVFVLE